MANDRLFIACPKCNESKLLAKYWGGGEYATSMHIEDLAGFLAKHTMDCLDWYDGMDCPRNWKLETERNVDWTTSDTAKVSDGAP